jgi:hypothetical protein
MKKNRPVKINAQLTRVFIEWMLGIGYRAVVRTDGIHFMCHVCNQNFPRGAVIGIDGKLNKTANKLFSEFYSYVEDEVK